MRVLITGGAGFIGSHIAEYFQGKADVRVFDSLRSGYRKNLDGLDVEFIEGDIRDREAVAAAMQGVDYVFHLAAMISVPESMSRVTECIDINGTGMIVVLEEAAKAGVKKLCFSTSAAIYGDNPVVPKVETMFPEPKSPYAITKLDGEYYCKMFNDTGKLKTACLRYFNVFGQRQDPYGAYAAVIPQWFAALTKGDTVYVNGDGETSRDFCYIDNVVQANLLASYAADDARNLVYNVAFGQRTTLNELFGLIRDEVVRHKPEAAEAKPAYRDFRAGDVRHSLADITRARTLLGYEPEYDVRQGLRLAGDWYDTHL